MVDLVEGKLLAGDGLDGHDDQGDVAVRRLLLTAGACDGIRFRCREGVPAPGKVVASKVRLLVGGCAIRLFCCDYRFFQVFNLRILKYPKMDFRATADLE